MVVAGDHAVNDMSGDEDDSWRAQAAALGTEPVCILKGLGEYESIRALYVEHARNAVTL
jgi:sirohydrochlorin cobaltochelatase